MLHSVQDSMGSATLSACLNFQMHARMTSGRALHLGSVVCERGRVHVSGMGASAACMTHAGLEHIQAGAGASAAKQRLCCPAPRAAAGAGAGESGSCQRALQPESGEQKPEFTKFEHLPSMYRAVQITRARFTLVQSGAIVFTGRKEGQAVSACPQRRCRFRYAAWRLRTCLLLHASWTTVLKPFYLLIRSLLEAYSDSGMVKAGL